MGAAQVAAIAAASSRAISDIQSGTFEGGSISGGGLSAPNVPTNTLSGPGFNLGAPQLGGTSGVTNINAVVLAGDVTSAQAQEAAIRNRRRFG